MRTISENLQLLEQTKENIKNSLIEKGKNMENVPFTEYYTKIDELNVSKENKLAKLVSGKEVALTASDLGDITAIGDYAFYKSKLSSISMPNSITSIGYQAFYNVVSLMCTAM